MRSSGLKKIILLYFIILCSNSFLFRGSYLIAQIVEDSVTVVEELVPVEENSYDEEKKTILRDKFIRKNEVGYTWQPDQQMNIPDSTLKKYKEQDAFWYADKAFGIKKNPKKNDKIYTPLGQRAWFRTLIWLIIIGCFAAFLITYLSGSSVGLFRKKNIVFGDEEEEEMPDDIFAINYQKETEKAVAIKNYRLAVRLMFLNLLKNMSERNIITYKQDKTNFDYLSELYSSSLYPHFFKVTRNYEYSWYGQFPITDEAFQLIKKDFDPFNDQL